MRIVFKKPSRIYVLIILAVLSQSVFFHLCPSSSIAIGIYLLSSIVAFLFSFIGHQSRGCYYAGKYIIEVVLFVFVLQGVYTVATGMQSMSEYFEAIYLMIPVIIVRPIIKEFSDEEGINSLIDTVSMLVSIFLTIVIVNMFFRNTFGVSVINNEWYTQVGGSREGRIRIMLLTPFLCFVNIYAFANLIANKVERKVTYIYEYVITLVAEIYVEQTRMILITMLVSCAIMYSVKMKKRRAKYFLYIASIFLIIITFLTGAADEYLGTFSLDNVSYGVSTLNRMYEYRIAFQNWIHNFIFGTGLVKDYVFRTSVGGHSFLYNHTDVGIIGSLSYMGISAIVLYIIPLVRYIRMLKTHYSDHKDEYLYILSLGLISYLLITSITINITDVVRIFAWPFVMAVLEYTRQKFQWSN